ncbi:peptide/nickel transport system ATP-binding protein [Actinocorallia herbida]|uniref:Peptide/nickel transport system ATP-binding protein n=1 Tax=Actinocorallia herbida TaxID=58109 RepID=A0A3N1D0G1_9ACTN|nr:ABC transporter ATP-binding protein [Actinocorallia herbida]ROO86996.1 peptide/nickel transport system ATP-binding protein [Actinocorallia herbida]
MTPLLDVAGLTVSLPDGTRLVHRLDLALRAGERVALVGESGSGKSVAARAVMRLDDGLRLGGSVRLAGRELLGLTERQMQGVRGGGISMVMQDPLTALNPVLPVGVQVAEPLRIRGVPKRAARREAIEMLDRLGVPRAAERADAYPHEFSGGMRQRVVLAAALIAQPSVLIADEPTTALDVRVQEQVLSLIEEFSRDLRLAVLLITHDLGIVAGFADRVAVMYAGRLVEVGDVDAFYAGPRHPYGRALLASVPRVDRDPGRRLDVIGGVPATPKALPSGCAFHPRCHRAEAVCAERVPELKGQVACHLVTS